jgi:sugar phosphate isomerase/epimerase
MAVRRHLASLGVLAALAAFGATAAGAGEKPKRALANPFFVFNNGVKDATYDTPQKQVALLERLGYDGMEKNGLDDFAEVQGELDRQGLKLFTVYVNVNLDPGQPAYDPRLPEVIRSLKGRPTMLWLNITNMADKSDRGTIWKSLIQPLGQGTFDTYALLETLVDLGFEGPVGLQCYNVPGDKADILAQSMAAWRGYEDRMAR